MSMNHHKPGPLLNFPSTRGLLGEPAVTNAMNPMAGRPNPMGMRQPFAPAQQPPPGMGGPPNAGSMGANFQIGQQVLTKIIDGQHQDQWIRATVFSCKLDHMTKMWLYDLEIHEPAKWSV